MTLYFVAILSAGAAVITTTREYLVEIRESSHSGGPVYWRNKHQLADDFSKVRNVTRCPWRRSICEYRHHHPSLMNTDPRCRLVIPGQIYRGGIESNVAAGTRHDLSFRQAIIISFHVSHHFVSFVVAFSRTLYSRMEKHYRATLSGHSSDRGGCRRWPAAIIEINTTL